MQASSHDDIGRSPVANEAMTEGPPLRRKELVEKAKEAAARRDWPEAFRRWDAVRTQFPDFAWAHVQAGKALRSAGRTDEAEALFASAMTRFPDLASVAIGHARVAAARRDWPEALRRWEEVRARFPDRPEGGVGAAQTSRALHRLEETRARKALVKYAQEATRRRDWLEAYRRWDAVLARDPGRPGAYSQAGRALRHAGRLNEAETLLAAALARFSDHAAIASEHAGTATARRDWPEALRRWEAVAAKFPLLPHASVNAAQARRALERREAAKAREKLVQQAQEAAAGGDWPAALLRWEAVRTRFPQRPEGYIGAANAARALGRNDEAIGLAAELRRRFPGNPSGYRIAAAILRHGSRFDEAEAVLRQASACLPAESRPDRELALVVRHRANRARAAKLIDKLPDGLCPARGPAIAPTPRRVADGGKVFVVLGMHRAGTSLCTGIIARLGIELGGPLTRPTADNPDGFQEHAAVLACHQTLLDAMDADWDTFWLVDPPPEAFWGSAIAATVRDRLQALVAEQLQSAGGAWAFKDPRTVRFLPLWREVFANLGVQPVFILAVRDPRSTAASLLARDGIGLALGELLWIEHYLDALRHVGAELAAIVHYERWFSAPIAQAGELSAVVGAAGTEAIEVACGSIRASLRKHARGPASDTLDLARALQTRGGRKSFLILTVYEPSWSLRRFCIVRCLRWPWAFRSSSSIRSTTRLHTPPTASDFHHLRALCPFIAWRKSKALIGILSPSTSARSSCRFSIGSTRWRRDGRLKRPSQSGL
jgi:tetratricopeptide (TPR) repeat protein